MSRSRSVVLAATALVALTSCAKQAIPTGSGDPSNAPLAQTAGWDDTCVVGDWRLVDASLLIEVSGREVRLRSSGDRELTVTRGGRLEVDFPGAGLVWHGTNGQDIVDASVTGHATGTYATLLGRWETVMDNSASVTTLTVNGTLRPSTTGGAEETNSQTVSCRDDELVITGTDVRTVYRRR